MLAIVVVLIVQFFVNLSLASKVGMGNDFRSLAQMLFISQVVCIAPPGGVDDAAVHSQTD